MPELVVITEPQNRDTVSDCKYPELRELAKQWDIAYYILINAIRT